MFTKGMKYRFFADAVQQPSTRPTSLGSVQRREGRQPKPKETRDIGSVWRIPGESVPSGMSPFPVALIERLMLLSTQAGDHVLDPFGGTGTVGVVATTLGRQYSLIELNPAFAANARKRIAGTPAL